MRRVLAAPVLLDALMASIFLLDHHNDKTHAMSFRMITNGCALKHLESAIHSLKRRIDNVRFKKQVVPGDTLIFKLVMTEPIRRGIVKMTGKAYVGSSLVCEAEMMAQIVKEKNK